jgi:pimeloyl-ACP methyl ester carboxylesterase
MKGNILMKSTKTNTLRVPGASLYYEVRGSGPLLLLIHGGGGDTNVFNGIANQLVDQYTVATYDRRGLSRSMLDDPEEEQRVETYGDDAHFLLKELGTEYEPALVFGSSGGAVVGLDLVARYPEQVRGLISHEPPTHLLPEADPIQELAALRETYRREGLMAVLRKMAVQDGLNPNDQEPDVEPMGQAVENRERAMKNMIFLLERELPAFDRYQIDFAALKNASARTRIVLAGGTGREDSTYRSAVAVANQLGAPFVDFPGRHVGYMTHPRAFAAKLRAVLGDLS